MTRDAGVTGSNDRNSLHVPRLGAAVPQRGNRLSQWMGRTYLAMTAWGFRGALPDLPKFVIIVAPHTSNWDFMVGMGTVFALGLRVSFLVKHTMFWEPMGTYLRWLGAVPIDRRAAHGSVGEAIEAFHTREKFVLAITPEGTRRRVARWKTGFYHIALGANVPIVPVGFDYGRKQVRIGLPLLPTGNLEGDVAQLRAFFDDVTGKYPHQF